MTDKKKKAELISKDLSIQLFSVSLTLIGVLGGVFTYLLDKPLAIKYSWLFYLVVLATFVAFVVSIYFGGKGVNLIRKYIGESITEEDYDKSPNYFNRQVWAGLFGLVGLFALLFFNSAKEDEYLDEIKNINKNLKINEQAHNSIKALGKRVSELEIQLDSLESLTKDTIARKPAY